MTHDRSNTPHGRGPAAALASAWNAVCCLPATHPWFWLVRPGAVEAAAPVGLVLLDGVPRLLVALGQEVIGHG